MPFYNQSVLVFTSTLYGGDSELKDKSRILLASMLFIFILASGCLYFDTEKLTANQFPDLDDVGYELAVKFDNTDPNILEAPENATYEAQKDNITLQWLFNDAYPWNYTLYEDDVIVDQDTWSNGVYVNYSVGLRNPVTINYTMIVMDDTYHSNQTTTLLNFIDTTAPSIDSFPDMTKELMDEGNITWQLSDYQSWDYPAPYWIYSNGSVVADGEWTSDDEIVCSLKELEIGKYNFTILASDTHNNNVSDTVWITVVDTTVPTISSPDDLVISEGTLDQEITWICYDLDPANWSVRVNPGYSYFDAWNGENITFHFHDFELGEYNITLNIRDRSGNSISDTVKVTVVDDTSPVIVEVVSSGTWRVGSTEANITWTATDLHPHSYAVYINGTEYTAGIWNTTFESVVVPLGHLEVGIYNVTIAVFDGAGNRDTHTMFVTVIGSVPNSFPGELILGIGLAGAGIIIILVFMLKKKGMS